MREIRVKDLIRGDVVLAIKLLDRGAANVKPGTMGVVFQQANYHEDGAGPIVRWMNMSVCNIYEDDVKHLRVPFHQ